MLNTHRHTHPQQQLPECTDQRVCAHSCLSAPSTVPGTHRTSAHTCGLRESRAEFQGVQRMVPQAKSLGRTVRSCGVACTQDLMTEPLCKKEDGGTRQGQGRVGRDAVGARPVVPGGPRGWGSLVDRHFRAASELCREGRAGERPERKRQDRPQVVGESSHPLAALGSDQENTGRLGLQGQVKAWGFVLTCFLAGASAGEGVGA